MEFKIGDRVRFVGRISDCHPPWGTYGYVKEVRETTVMVRFEGFESYVRASGEACIGKKSVVKTPKPKNNREEESR